MAAHELLTAGKPRVCWRFQSSGARVQHSGKVPEGQAAISGCAAQEQSPGSQEKTAGSVRGMESNRGPHSTIRAPLTSAG